MAGAATLTGCGWFADDGPIRVVAIGGTDVTRGAAGEALRLATAGPLVAADAVGDIDVGLAERWTVTADGLSYIFRLRDARWTDGSPVTAAQVAEALRALMRPGAVPGGRALPAGTRVAAMTARVVELRLTRPAPDMLSLLSQPAMGIRHRGHGWGPMRATPAGDGRLLSLSPDNAALAEGSGDAPPPDIALIARPAARAVARFRNNAADAVIGGRFTDAPLLAVADLPAEALVVDPVAGLFGLLFVNDGGFLGASAHRDAIASVITRGRIVSGFGVPGWQMVDTLRPGDGDPRTAPFAPAWSDRQLDARRAHARALIAAWSRDRPISPLRIALPDGPGATRLFAFLADDLGRIGLAARRVGPAAPADLRLVDDVAPSLDRDWPVLALACRTPVLCTDAVRRDMRLARDAVDADIRRDALTAIERQLVLSAGYIPIARPLRWSLSSRRTPGLRPSRQGVHPLNRIAARPT